VAGENRAAERKSCHIPHGLPWNLTGTSAVAV